MICTCASKSAAVTIGPVNPWKGISGKGLSMESARFREVRTPQMVASSAFCVLRMVLPERLDEMLSRRPIFEASSDEVGDVDVKGVHGTCEGGVFGVVSERAERSS